MQVVICIHAFSTSDYFRSDKRRFSLGFSADLPIWPEFGCSLIFLKIFPTCNAILQINFLGRNNKKRSVPIKLFPEKKKKKKKACFQPFHEVKHLFIIPIIFNDFYTICAKTRAKCWTLCSKIQFSSVDLEIAPFSPKQWWFFYFLDCTDHSAPTYY